LCDDEVLMDLVDLFFVSFFWCLIFIEDAFLLFDEEKKLKN
jgi:hypothetical protein